LKKRRYREDKGLRGWNSKKIRRVRARRYHRQSKGKGGGEREKGGRVEGWKVIIWRRLPVNRKEAGSVLIQTF